MPKKRPIGIFDSGVGGTSIWKEIQQLLPNEDTIYLADSKNAPYGQKSPQTIVEYCKKNTALLQQYDCKIIVVACNTATTNAISFLRKNHNIPFIGIEPAIKPAALKTKTNTIGILATQGTLSSELFSKTSTQFGSNVSIIEQVGEDIVPLIENGQIDSKEMDTLLKKYLQPMLAKNIDYLVLGCTHYPYLIPKIKQLVGDKVTIIDSGEAVARQTKAILKKYDLLTSSNKKGTHQFFTNTNTKVLQSLVQTVDNTKVQVLDF